MTKAERRLVNLENRLRAHAEQLGDMSSKLWELEWAAKRPPLAIQATQILVRIPGRILRAIGRRLP